MPQSGRSAPDDESTIEEEFNKIQYTSVSMHATNTNAYILLIFLGFSKLY